MIAAASFLLLALIGLASVIDLPQREPESASGSELGDSTGGLGSSGSPQDLLDNGSSGESGSGGSGAGGSQGLNGNGGQGFPGFGDGGSARVDAGEGNGFDVRPVPNCPGAFAIGENILVVPDPEACGLILVPPGTFAPDPNGIIILVPSPNGDVGGLRPQPDGTFDLVAPDDVRPDDLVIGRNGDGSYELQRPDGSRVEISPREGGLDLRDPSTGNEEFVPGPSDESLRDLFEDLERERAQEEEAQREEAEREEQRAQEREEERQREERDRNREPADLSFLAPLLVVLLVGVVLAFLAMAFKDGSFQRSSSASDLDDDDEVVDSGLQDTLVDYSAEINALDRLLWEVDQEPDPRTAIRRVYAALETGLDNPEMARRRSETPGIYLRRILGRFDELEMPLRELTLLFEQARFSEHEITHDMRNRAVTILVAVRGHYASAAALAELQAESAAAP